MSYLLTDVDSLLLDRTVIISWLLRRRFHQVKLDGLNEAVHSSLSLTTRQQVLPGKQSRFENREQFSGWGEGWRTSQETGTDSQISMISHTSAQEELS